MFVKFIFFVQNLFFLIIFIFVVKILFSFKIRRTRRIRDNEKAAVAVWFHGGAFAWGGGSSPLYNGQFVAPMMDNVIVAVNYRLSDAVF